MLCKMIESEIMFKRVTIQLGTVFDDRISRQSESKTFHLFFAENNATTDADVVIRTAGNDMEKGSAGA